MKCRLCDGPTAGTDKLCVDCAKALKRARARASALRNPPASLPDQVEATTASAPSSLAPLSVLASGWRRHVAWAAAGLVTIGIIYLAQREPGRPPADAVAVDRAPTSVSASEPAKVNAPAVSMPSEASSAPVPSTLTPVAVKTGATAGTTSKNANRESKSSSPPSTPAKESAAGKAKGGLPSEPEASQLLARASVSPSVPPADTGQSFASALAKCGNEGLLTRFICEQKLYLQYCEDKWDKDRRCMRSTGSN